jgi:lysophospholipase L1-like esterase
MSEDGLHPNDKGYQVIAERLRSLGYEPLYPR